MTFISNYPPVSESDIEGKPYITVSTKGIANGLSDIPNDGTDFGPDTMLNATSKDQYGPPYSNTLGIQEAVNYAAAMGGGIVLLKAGTYIITTPIDLSLTKNITLMGVSAQYGHVPSFSGTVLKLGASIDAMIKIDNSAWGTGTATAQNNPCNNTIKNLLLYGNREAGYTAHGIYMNVVGGGIIDGVGIFDFAGAGIYATQSKIDAIINSAIGGAETSATAHTTSEIGSTWFPNNYGIYLDGVGAHFIINKCSIAHNEEDGIYITNVADVTEDVWVSDTGIYWNDGAGININNKTGNAFWFIHVNDSIVDENLNNGILVQNNSGSTWGLNLLLANTQLIGNGRGNTSAYGMYITSTTGYTVQGIYITNIISIDPIYNAQQSIYINYVNGIDIIGGGYGTAPVMTSNSSQVNIGNVATPYTSGGLPFYTSLPTGAFTGEVVLYYNGTNYQICAYLGGAWQCATL